jgi:response regulator of citrate/malate metabolism
LASLPSAVAIITASSAGPTVAPSANEDMFRLVTCHAYDSIRRSAMAAERPMRAAQIAERAGVERGTANRYLTYPCDTLIAEREAEHGRPGHPAFLYTLASIWEPGSGGM